MIQTHFNDRDLIFLVTGLVSACASVILFMRGKVALAGVTIILAGFVLRLWMAFIDPFVNIWDEQYHALVAKNLAEHFFTPTLVDQPLQATDPAYWAYTHVWLHKPPLFLWQMALSIKMFGTTEWAIRIPSVLLSTLMIPAVFRMGKHLSGERTGYIAAVLVASSNILINVNSGFLNTDQNDGVFVSYICFSFWAWVEYIYAPRKRWIVLTGIFAGAAILTKWLPGAMVFGAWGIALITDKSMRTNLRSWLHLSLAVLVCALVAAPWFIYASQMWPESFSAAMMNYTGHFDDSMTHGGSWWYHFSVLKEQNGTLFICLFVTGALLIAADDVKRSVKWGMFFTIAVVFLFYSLVQARMPLFCLPLLPLLILFAAHLLNRIAESGMYHRLRGAKFIAGAILLLLLISNVNTGRIEHYHTDRNVGDLFRPARIHNRAVFEKALNGIPENTVVFNCSDWNAVPCMFYVNCTAFDKIPNEEQIAAAKEQQRPVYVFDDGQLPAYITSDPAVTVIADSLVRNGF